MPKKALVLKKSRTKKTSHPPRMWYQLRRHSKEPILTRAHKFLIFVLALGGVIGMGWNLISKADARYAKEQPNIIFHKEIRHDIALLGRSFEYDSLDRAIIFKQEQIYKVQDRLNQRLSPRDRRDQEELLRSLQGEYDNLRKKQQRLEQQINDK